MKNQTLYIIIAVVAAIIIIYLISVAKKTAEIKRQMELDRYANQPAITGEGVQGWVNAIGGLGTAFSGLFGKDDGGEELTEAEQKEIGNVMNMYNDYGFINV